MVYSSIVEPLSRSIMINEWNIMSMHIGFGNKSEAEQQIASKNRDDGSPSFVSLILTAIA
jgi:hypothetical protein